jgi:hypothetical protein
VKKGTKGIEYVIREIRVFYHIPIQKCGTGAQLDLACTSMRSRRRLPGALFIDAEPCGNSLNDLTLTQKYHFHSRELRLHSYSNEHFDNYKALFNFPSLPST